MNEGRLEMSEWGEKKLKGGKEKVKRGEGEEGVENRRRVIERMQGREKGKERIKEKGRISEQANV